MSTSESGPPREVRKLYRSRSERKIAGVCGGIADYFAIDPTVVRVGAVVTACFGAGIIAYVAAWILMPQEPEDSSETSG